MDPHADLVKELLTVFGVLAWIGVGIWLAHVTRASACLEKILVAVFFTKGFFIYWLLYVIVVPISKLIQLIIRVIAGLIDWYQARKKVKTKNKLSLVCVLLVVVVTGCDMNLTDTVLLDDMSTAPQHVEVTTISEIPDHIKDLIWRDLDELIAELLNLETGNEVEARKLLALILTHQKQEEYYNKYVDAGGIAIIGAKTLSDEEMLEAHKIALTMTEKRPELREKLSLETGFYFILTDLEWTRGKPKTLPEYHEWEVEFGGGAPVRITVNMCLTVSGRFMCLASAGKRVQIKSKTYQIDCGDYWCTTEVQRRKWDAFTHEMAHAIEHAARQIDPNFYLELRLAHENALEKNLWEGYYQGDYAMGNWKEYWAVASVYWFFTVQRETRNSLQDRDPLIYNLLSKWYPVTEPFDSTF